MSRVNQLRTDIIAAFSNHWALNDVAHRVEHFEAVFQAGCIINNHFEGIVDEESILIAAYFHDLFAWSRINHHQLSHNFIDGTDHPVLAEELRSKWKRENIALACLEHRASYKGAFSTPFCELINSADRGVPGDIAAMVERSRKYWLAYQPHLSDDERMAGVIAHIKEKFSSNGYARYPDMYKRVFGEQLELQRQAIDKL